MKKVLVCGGSGFIGQNIIKFLQKKPYKIFATYNSKKPKGLDFVKWIKSDLTSIKDVRKTTHLILKSSTIPSCKISVGPKFGVGAKLVRFASQSITFY